MANIADLLRIRAGDGNKLFLFVDVPSVFARLETLWSKHGQCTVYQSAVLIRFGFDVPNYSTSLAGNLYIVDDNAQKAVVTVVKHSAIHDKLKDKNLGKTIYTTETLGSPSAPPLINCKHLRHFLR